MCLFYILNEKKCILPKKKRKDSIHRFLYFYIFPKETFKYLYIAFEKFLPLMSLFILADTLKEHAIQMSQTFYVTCNRLHPSSTPL